MKKKISLLFMILIIVGVIVEAYHWINQIPEVRSALTSDKDQPKPVTNDWRMALLESVNDPIVEGIKSSIEKDFVRFNLDVKTKQITLVDNVLSKFNWPHELMVGPNNVPKSARDVHIKHLPRQLPFWRKKGVDIIILPLVAQGKYGLAAGFIAINSKDKTIAGLRFYHSEDTPGLGQKVLNSEFTNTFIGKYLFDDQENFALKIVRPGQVNKSNQYNVDGITGATMMSNGIQDALTFWIGVDAYGDLLK